VPIVNLGGSVGKRSNWFIIQVLSLVMFLVAKMSSINGNLASFIHLYWLRYQGTFIGELVVAV